MLPRGKCWLGARPAGWLLGFLVLDYRSAVARGRVPRRRRFVGRQTPRGRCVFSHKSVVDSRRRADDLVSPSLGKRFCRKGTLISTFGSKVEMAKLKLDQACVGIAD